MPMYMPCPECGEQVTFSEAVRGRKIRCRSCQAIVLVPEQEEERALRSSRGATTATATDARDLPPRRRRLRDDDGDDRTADGNTTLIYAGIGVGGLLIVAGLIFALMGDDKKRDSAVAPANTAESSPKRPESGTSSATQPPGDASVFPDVPPKNPQTGNPVGIGGNPPLRPPGGNPTVPVTELLPTNLPDVPPIPEHPFGREFPGVGRKIESQELAQFGSTAWKVPLPEVPKVELPEKLKATLTLFNETVTFPTTPSPYVLLGRPGNPRQPLALWDVTKGKPTVLKIQPQTQGTWRNMVLHPDGKRLLLQGRSNLEVWSLDKMSANLEIPNTPWNSIQFFDFGAENNVVYVRRQGAQLTFHAVSLSNGESKFAVAWEFTKHTPFLKVALHPSRQFLVTHGRDLLYFYSCLNGDLIGVLPCPQLPESERAFHLGMETLQLAFSPDGRYLAGIFASQLLSDAFQVTTWDLKTQKVIGTGDITPLLKNQFYRHQELALQFTPDSKALLVRGTTIIDPRDGATLLSIPRLSQRMTGLGDTPPRMLPNWQMLEVVQGTGLNYTLTLRDIDRQRLETVVTSPTTPPVANLPAAKAVDRSAVKTIVVDGNPRWSVKPDPAEPLRLTPFLLQTNDPVNAVALSCPPDPRLAALRIGESKSAQRRTFRLEVYQWSDGRLAYVNDLAYPVRGGAESLRVVADLSPSGKLFVCTDPNAPQRIDVWFANDGKHLVGFVPAEDPKAKLEWLGFIDDQRLLTLDKNGKLTLWSIAEAKALYQMQTACLVPTFSPNRKILAVFLGTRWDLLDPMTGESRGAIGVTTVTGMYGNGKVSAFAFSPNGKRFAISGQANTRPVTAVGNLEDGKVTTMFPTPSISNGALIFCNDRYLLADHSRLIDLKQKMVVWTYINPLGGFRHSLDGRLWQMKTVGQPTLQGVRLPDTATASVLAMIDQHDPAQVVLKPGMSLAIDLQIAPSVADANVLRSQILSDLTNRLAQEGFTVANNAPLRMVISGQEKESDVVLERVDSPPRIGFPAGALNPPPSPGNDRVVLKDIDASITITDSQSRQIYSHKTFLKDTRFSASNLGRPNKTIEQIVNESIWLQFRQWCTSSNWPIYVFNLGGRMQPIPGFSTMPAS